MDFTLAPFMSAQKGPNAVVIHGIVQVTLLVTLNNVLHGQTTIKHNVNKRGIWQDIGNNSEGRESTQ